MRIRTVAVEEVMQRIKNHDNMDNYQVIHKLNLFTGEYVIQNVTEVKISELMSDEYVIVEIY